MGVLLFQAASAIEMAYQSGDQSTMMRSLAKLKTYFIIMGIVTLIGIILGIVGIFFGFLGAIFSAVGLTHV